MHVGERVVATWTDAAHAPEIGWFAAQQPGVIRFLGDRLVNLHGSNPRAGEDTLAVALEAACAIAAMFERQHGLPPPRVPPGLLERAEEAVVREVRLGQTGLAQRQPALVGWLAELADNPPLPLDRDELRAVTTSLAAVIYALDQLTTGRPVP